MPGHLPTSWSLRSLALVTWFGALGSVPAVAAQDDAVELSSEVEFRRVVADALDEYERAHWEESEALFMRAHEIKPSARTLRGLGLAAFEARHYTDALHYLRDSLSDERQPLNEHQRTSVQTTIARARLFVAHLRVEVQPANAEVRINGELVKAGPTGEIVADVGRLDITINADGYEVWTNRLRMSGGQREILRVDLVPLAQRPTRAVAAAKMVTTAAPTTVSAISAPTTLSVVSASPTVSARSTSTTVFAPATLDAASTASSDSEPTSSFSTWKWVVAGGAAAAVATGGAMLLVQRLEASSYIEDCTNTSKLASDCVERKVRLGSTLWTGSIMAFSIGAALAATSITLFAIDAREGAEGQSALRCSTAGIGVGCSGRF